MRPDEPETQSLEPFSAVLRVETLNPVDRNGLITPAILAQNCWDLSGLPPAISSTLKQSEAIPYIVTSCRSGLLEQWIETTSIKLGVVSILIGYVLKYRD